MTISSLNNEVTPAHSGLVIAGTYRLGRRIGSGAMADVYEAEHLRLQKQVAVKLLRVRAAGDRRALERFRREGPCAAKLRSPHIVTVFDCGELPDGSPYVVMEKLEGQDLRYLLKQGRPLHVARAARIVRDACLGLAAVHAAGLVHRDLKPANLFVSRDFRGDEVCTILDFGVAKRLESDSTSRGAVIGTIRYMAPEQLVDSASAGPSSDLYALAAILYELLTGTPPHSEANLHELMFAKLHREPPPACHLRADVDPELSTIVVKNLERMPERRMRSALEFEQALACWAQGGSRNCTEGTLSDSNSEEDLPRPLAGVAGGVRRHPALLVGAFTVLAALASGTAGTLLYKQGQQRAASAQGLTETEELTQHDRRSWELPANSRDRALLMREEPGGSAALTGPTPTVPLVRSVRSAAPPLRRPEKPTHSGAQKLPPKRKNNGEATPNGMALFVEENPYTR